jgi:hypothetical protein
MLLLTMTLNSLQWSLKDHILVRTSQPARSVAIVASLHLCRFLWTTSNQLIKERHDAFSRPSKSTRSLL